MTQNSTVKVSSSSTALAQKKRLRETELLLEISRRMSAIDSLDAVLSALVEMTTVELGAERGTLFLNDTDTANSIRVWRQVAFSVKYASSTPVAWRATCLMQAKA
ncbi:MAG: hypothetical protein WDM70_09985 [Nitrosomonadales bacterium]